MLMHEKTYVIPIFQNPSLNQPSFHLSGDDSYKLTLTAGNKLGATRAK